MEDIARKILLQVKAMVPGRFETLAADERTHPHVDWKAYYEVRKHAALLGFQHLGDVDPISVHLDPKMMKRAVLAIFTNDEGTEVLGHYRVVLRWTWQGILARMGGVTGNVFDLGTHFGGAQGVIVETSTAQVSAVWDQPDFVLRETLGHGTKLDYVVQRHRERVREYVAQHREARPTVVRTLADVVRMSDVHEQRKLTWRRARGWMTRDELARLGKLQAPMLDQLYDTFREVAQEAE